MRSRRSVPRAGYGPIRKMIPSGKLWAIVLNSRSLSRRASSTFARAAIFAVEGTVHGGQLRFAAASSAVRRSTRCSSSSFALSGSVRPVAFARDIDRKEMTNISFLITNAETYLYRELGAVAF